MFQLIKNPKIDFVGKRKIAYVVSGLLMVLGLVALVQVWRGHANLGIDFEGGSLVQVRFTPPFETDGTKALARMRAVLEQNGLPGVEVQNLLAPQGSGHASADLLIRIRKSDLAVGQAGAKVRGVCEKELPDYHSIAHGETLTAGAKTIEIIATEEVGPAVGKSLRADAVNAILGSMILLFLYVWFRFDRRFGVGAVVATFHDVLAVLGVFWIANKEINLLLVTSLLTLAGYSLTDTVVVFDRIRENLKLLRKDTYEAIFNASINEVLSRTIITSTTVFLVCVALYVFGSPVTRDFALALGMGVIVGTYSSIFVASPVVLEVENFRRRGVAAAARTDAHAKRPPEAPAPAPSVGAPRAGSSSGA